MALVFALVVCSAVILETWGAPIPILQKFEWTPGVVTYGNDDRTVEDVDTADGCAVLCLQETTFICKSFDFRSKEKVCMLSKGNSYTAGVGLRLAAGADLYEVLPDYIPTEVPTTTARPTAAKPTDPTTPEGEGKDDPNAGGLRDQPSAEPVSTKRKGVDKDGQDKETEEDEDMADGKVTKARRKDREGRRKKNRGKEDGEEGNGGKNGRRGRKRGRQGRRNGERKNRRGKGRNGGNGKRTPKKSDKEVEARNTNDVTKTSGSTTPKTTVPPRQTTPEPEPYQTPSPLDSDIEGGATAVAMTTQVVPSDDGDVSETLNSLQDDVDDVPPDVAEGNTAGNADAVTGDGPSVDGNSTEEEPAGQPEPEQGLP